MLQRAEEHLIETKRIGTILIDDHIRVHYVEHGFGHLLDRPTADILTVLEDKLRVVVFRAPLLEGLQVENIVGDNVYVHVNRCYLVLVSQIVRDESIGILDAVNKVRAALDHTLVDQFLERLLLAYQTEVEQELVPETAIDQVARSVLRTADIQIDITPVFVNLLIHQCLMVAWIHITQVVSR